MIADRTQEMVDLLLFMADLVDADPVYVPVFQRMDEEFAAYSSAHHTRLARTRANIARAAASD